MRLMFLSALLSVVAFVCLPLAHAGTPLPDGPHIVTRGEGKVSVAPDSARVRFAFSHRGAQLATSKQAVDAAVNRLLDTVADRGIAPADVRASDLDAGEDTDYDDDGKPVRLGYYAQRSVTVVLKDMQYFNDFLDEGLAAGASGIEDIAFESTRADALRKQAKAEAVADAQREAKEMANAFGAELGMVYSINSVNSQFASSYGESTTLDRIQVTGTRLPRGRYIQPSVEYTAQVSAVFELRP